MPDSRPNIVLIMCDQLRHDCLGFAGHPIIQTPNLDALAQRGVVFENAYCASPVCSPARASWLTGLYPHAHGQLRNYSASWRDRIGCMLDPDCTTISDALKQAGYRCGIVGPWHMGNDHLPQHGLTDFWCTYRYQGGHADRLGDYFAEQGLPNRYAKGAPGITDDGMGFKHGTIDDPRQQRTTWTIDRGLDFLKGKDDRPFFLFLSVKDPHPVMLPPSELVAMYRPDQIDLPPTWRDPLVNKPAFQRTDRCRIPETVTENQFRTAVCHYYALITHIDHQVGRLLAAMMSQGLDENTIVVFMSDHGEMLGDHGFIGKVVMYENSVRVPLVLSCPAQAPAGQRVQSPLGGVDLMPTLLELAGVPLEAKIDGRSVAQSIRDGHDHESQPVFAEICTWKALKAQSDDTADMAARVMVRDGDHKYVWNQSGMDEFYDLAADPLETDNLAERPDQSDSIAALQQSIIEMLGCTGPGPYRWCLDAMNRISPEGE